MKITLPLPPNMANSRMHWRVKHNKRQAYFESCDIVSLTVKEQPLAAPKMRVRATMFLGGEMDHDNALARLKWPIDWMVQRKLLRGDKPSQLEWDWPIKQVVGRKQLYRVEFEITEAA